MPRMRTRARPRVSWLAATGSGVGVAAAPGSGVEVGAGVASGSGVAVGAASSLFWPMLASSVAEHDRPRQLRLADARHVACGDRCCGAKAVFGW